MKGVVRWFSDSKGYGFIDGTNEREYFVHYTQILGDGFKTLNPGQEVEFDMYETDLGFEAKGVKKI